jgi:uncharacterized membrane protein YhaH (DUF805 family)
MNWYIGVLKQYFVFYGRARRAEYWNFVLFNIIVSIILSVIDHTLGTYDPETEAGLLGGIYSLLIILPSLGVTVRRLHDTDRSGWWILISLIPLIGAIVLLIFLVQDSQPEQNRFGVNPKLVNSKLI